MLAFLSLLFLAAPAFAHSDGMTGQSTTGCGSCHGATAAASTTATLSATSTTLAPGARTNVSLRVRTTSTTRTHAGLNVSASGGTLGAGTNTVRSGSEITHASPQALTSGSINFRFTWRAPSTPGTYTIYAAGNAVNNNGASSGDGWRLATPITLTVASGAMTPDEVEVEGLLAADEVEEAPLDEALTPEEFVDLWLRTVEAGEGLDPADGEASDGDDRGLEAEGTADEPAAGCSALLGGASLGLAALGVAPLVARRRRSVRA